MSSAMHASVVRGIRAVRAACPLADAMSDPLANRNRIWAGKCAESLVGEAVELQQNATFKNFLGYHSSDERLKTILYVFH